MRASRRVFLKRTSALLAVAPLAGCLGEDSGQASAAPATSTTAAASTAQSASLNQPASPNQSASLNQPATPNQPAPTQPAENRGPIWQPAPTLEFVEGAPATISVREFVRDPDSDPLVIALASGTLIPGLTWNPVTAIIAYDGRPLGAKETTPVVVSGIVFTADDGKR